MTKKKTISLVMSAILALGAMFSFTACGGGNTKELTGIEITTQPTKVEYVLGEKFNPAGMVVSKTYADKTKQALAEDEKYTWDLTGNLKLTDKKVTVSYTEKEKTYKASVNIKVTNDIASVDIVTEPTTKDYIAGQTFDPTGMTIQAVRQNGTKDEVVTVTEDTVVYKTAKLVKSDEHFEMVYGGCKFYLDITVLHGAFVEAEAGQVDGARIESQGPDTSAIEKDYANAYGNRSDGQGHRGIDNGANCKDILGADNPDYNCEKGGAAGCKIEGTRVNVNYYVYDHLEWTETTGGEPAKSGMMQKNHIWFKRAGEKMLYKLTADKAGKVILTLKMNNPNIAAENSPIAQEVALNQVFKITVGGTEVEIPATTKLAEVDWTEYKAYNKSADVAVKGQRDQYTGASCVPLFNWQNIEVELHVEEGVNDLVIESLWTSAFADYGVRLDSLSCNGDADEIMLSLNSEFKPAVTSAQLKVVEGKVLMGVIVDAQAVGYTDDEIKGFFMKTTIAGQSSATYDGNVTSGSNDTNDPWTQPTDRGGLGYAAAPKMDKIKDKGYISHTEGQGAIESVDKITEGTYAGLFILWFDVTIPAENSDDYVGVMTISNFNNGTDFTVNKPVQDILKTEDGVTAEEGGYCYQVYCDSRDENVTFGWSNLCLVVQKGSFEGENACHKLMRRYVSHLTDNDQELIDLRQS